MITSAFIFVIFGFIFLITSPLRLLPDASLPDDVIEALGLASQHMSAVSFIFPIDTFLLILATVLTIEGGIILYRTIMWTIRKIPTIN